VRNAPETIPEAGDLWIRAAEGEEMKLLPTKSLRNELRITGQVLKDRINLELPSEFESALK
jgi:hypothetical protein